MEITDLIKSAKTYKYSFEDRVMLAQENEKATPLKTKYYFWVGNKSGYIWALYLEFPLRPKVGERFKYLGYTFDSGWPKKMNTGRLLQKPNKKDSKKKKVRKTIGF